jgi:hypothetical protein
MQNVAAADKSAGKPSKKSGGQVLVWPKGKNEESVKMVAVPIIHKVFMTLFLNMYLYCTSNAGENQRSQ